MATIERLGLALQLVQNLYGLVRDSRDNANDYKLKADLADAAVNDPSPSKLTTRIVATVMTKDADLYKQRLGWVSDAIARSEKLLIDALADLGASIDDVKALRDTLVVASDHTSKATLDTSIDIKAEADFVLATVPDFERLW